ncbi:hypothetical protein MUP77_20800 [Candidatus Bathyarchaeota archaeon]|nr:hypothetical protein [Candidatus Bathyarchaeota archaeon]
MKLNERVKSVLKFAVLVIALVYVAVLSGCKTEDSQKPLKQNLFIVLVDETESFALYKEGLIEQMYWPEVIPLINLIVYSLEPGDEFAVIGIDEQGFENEDVRIPFEVLDEGFLKAKIQKDKLAKVVRELQRRKDTHKSTDILGALYQAAHFASEETDRQTFVFCFSDMKQEPRWPTQEEAGKLTFPSGTECYFFFVDASGRNNWNTITNVWEPILSGAGLQIYSNNTLNFFQKGESKLRLEQVLNEIRNNR